MPKRSHVLEQLSLSMDVFLLVDDFKKVLQVRVGRNVGGCQNYGPFLGTLNIRCRIIIGTQKGTIILTTTQVIFQTQMLEGTLRMDGARL